MRLDIESKEREMIMDQNEGEKIANGNEGGREDNRLKCE